MIKRTVSVDDVLASIEFELAQGCISRDDLGASIQAVRQYHNKLRGEVLELVKRPEDMQEVVTRLFQINEMLVTIAQESNAALQSLRRDLRNTARWSQIIAANQDTHPITPAVQPSKEIESDQEQALSDLQSAIRAEAIRVEMDVRPIGTPVIGGWLQRARMALHDWVLFYVHQLAGKQARVNQTYGEWIERLIEVREYQQAQIDFLSAQVARLQARQKESEQLPASSSQV